MNARDFDYIESRLLAPCTTAGDAYERLKRHDPELAELLMSAMRTFTDQCRTVRTALASTYNRGTP